MKALAVTWALLLAVPASAACGWVKGKTSSTEVLITNYYSQCTEGELEFGIDLMSRFIDLLAKQVREAGQVDNLSQPLSMNMVGLVGSARAARAVMIEILNKKRPGIILH